MIIRDKFYIGGQWVETVGTEDRIVVNPATEEPVARVRRGNAEDVDRAAKAAAAAFEGWSLTSHEERSAIFRKMAQIMERRADEITHTIVSEIGQAISGAKAMQTAGPIRELNLFADLIPEIVWNEQVDNTNVRRVPAGVVGAMVAWNAPMGSVVTKAGAAMAAGCTVVMKSSEPAPLSAFIFAEICDEAGVPPGVLNVVNGAGRVAGDAIALHPLVDMVSLTGSVIAGSHLMELAAKGIKRISLELGGKSANIIFEDTDIERAVNDGLDDAFRNGGQVCGGLTRMLVQRSRLAEAAALAVKKAESFVVGDPFDPKTTLGPVVSADAQKRVRGYIQSGIDEGLKLLTGGVDTPAGVNRGFFVRPTVFVGHNQATLAREEIFGPVLVIIPFDDEDDAVRIANDSQYGLGGGIWAASSERARAVAARIRTGRVRINGAPLTKRAPHGGFKLSGIGREWGRVGMEEFLEYQSVIG